MTKFTTVLALILSFSLFGCDSKSSEKLDSRAIKFTQAMVFDDLKTAFHGGDASVTQQIAAQKLGINVRVSSKQLSTDYDANEIAGDQKYKSSDAIVVTGRVESISKDFTGSPYIALTGHQMFQGVQAKFDDKYSGSLASYKKGMNAEFVCKVSGKIVTSVMLKNCKTLDEHIKLMEKSVFDDVLESLKGKKVVTQLEAETLSIMYVFGLLLPENSVCHTSISEQCGLEFNALLKNTELLTKSKPQFEIIKAKLKIQP